MRNVPTTDTAVYVDTLNNAFAPPADMDNRPKLKRCGQCQSCGEEYGFAEFTLQFLQPLYCSCDRNTIERQSAEEESRRYSIRVEKVRAASGFDIAQAEARLDNYRTRDESTKIAKQWARAYLDHFDTVKRDGRCLLFYGSNGSGKTYICAAIGNALIDKGVNVKFVRCSSLLNRIHKAMNSRGEYIEDILREYQRCTLLILDELTAERSGVWEQEQLLEIISYREGNRKPTLFTSNHKPDDLEKLGMNPRIVSRVLGMCTGANGLSALAMYAPDFRRTAKGARV